jgi:autotransporter-associated beta strand protein
MSGLTRRDARSRFRHVLLRDAFACICALAALVAATVPAMAVNVTVNAGQTAAVMPLEGLGIHTSVYDNNLQASGSPTNSLLNGMLDAAGVTTLRYPGGGYADVYHFSTTRCQYDVYPSLPSNGNSPWYDNTASPPTTNYGWVGSKTDFGNFVKLLDATNSQTVITLNYGSAIKWDAGHTKLVPCNYGGQAKEAAAWVAYANGTVGNHTVIGTDDAGNNWHDVDYWASMRASAPLATDDGYNFLRINRPNPVGIKYWEVGNECFGTGYYGGGTGYALNYNVPYDGTNRAGNPALSPARYGQDVNAYVAAIKAVDPTVKVGAVLSTPPDDYSWDVYNGQHWNAQVLAQCANNIDFGIVHWYPSGNDNSGTDNGSILAMPRIKIPQMLNGTTSGVDTGANAGLRDLFYTYRTDHGVNTQIFVTETDGAGTTERVDGIFAADMYSTFLENGVTNVDWLELHSGSFLTDSNTPNFAYFGIQSVSKMVKPGDDIVAASSNNNGIRAHAALQADGTMAVMIVNTNSSGSSTVNISIIGDTLKTTGVRYATDGDSALIQSSVSGVGNSFSVSVPYQSIYVYLLSPIDQVNAAWALTGGGSWVTGTNWNWNRAPKNLGDIATLGNAIAGASAALTLDGNRTISSLTFNNTSGGSYTISPGTSIPSSKLILANQGSSAATVTVAAGNHSITSPVEMDSDVTLSAASGSSLNIQGQLSESGGARALSKTGSGILTLSASNSYTGATQINGGVIELTSAGQISASSSISTAGGTTLQIDAGSHALGTISGAGTVNLIAGDLTTNSISQNTITLGAGATLTITAIPGGPNSQDILPVPEPSVLALMAGAATVSLLGCLRRRQRRALCV